MIQIGIQSEILQTIIDGRKTIEGRLGKGKFLSLKVGDVISIREDKYQDGKIVTSNNDRLEIKIDAIKKFDTFEAMLRSVGYQNAIPNAEDLNDAVAQYRAYYSVEDESVHGVIAFYFQVVSS